MFVTDQRLTIPQRGLVGWWDLSIQKCYPDSGTLWTNLTGTATGNMTVSGTPSYTTGKPQGRKSVNLIDTSNQYAETNTGATALQPASAVSFSIWIKPNTYNASYNGVAGMSNAGNQVGYLFDTSNPNMNFNIGAASSWASARVARGATGVWTHYVGTWDGTTVRIYKNGVVSATTAAKAAISYTNAKLAIGRYPGASTEDADIRFAHAAVWNRALSADEITHLYNVTKRQFD